MRKFVLTFLLVLLPLQFVQAAMCPYCCSDDVPFSTQQDSSSHPDEALDADDPPSHLNYSLSYQCGFCDLTQAKFISWNIPALKLFKTEPPYLAEAIDYQSYIPRRLDRPNWMHFA